MTFPIVSHAPPPFRDILTSARLRLLRMHFESGVGHIGGNLSALDILMCLYHKIMGPHDQFILSKGHAAGALYATLWSIGGISEEELTTFHGEATRLSAHPPAHGIDEVLFATGSLGHGLSLAAGLALAKQVKSETGRVYCLMSDGEWNEGSCWEALIFCRHRKLNNLTFVVDANGLQGFGTTKDVADIEPLADKFRAFGLDVMEVDGHDPAAIIAAISAPAGVGPRAVVASTRKGAGVSFMENRMEWHYLPLTDDFYRQAVMEVQSECVTPSAGL